VGARTALEAATTSSVPSRSIVPSPSRTQFDMAFVRQAAAAFSQGVRASQLPARVAAAAPGVALGGAALLGLSATAVADEAEHGLHAPSYTWPHDGFFSAYDAAAIRRGHQVRTTPGVTHMSVALIWTRTRLTREREIDSATRHRSVATSTLGPHQSFSLRLGREIPFQKCDR
jgi:hypothetical protein